MLKGVNALDHGINQSWQQDNQAWWDWYVTLADNTDQCDDESLVELPPIPHFNVGLEHSIEDELSKPYTVTNSQRLDFRKNGFIKLPNVLSGGAVARLRQELLQLLEQSFRPKTNINDNNRFLSLEMMWLQNTLLKSYVLSPRIAKISADLLGVESVRLYHDNALAKEPLSLIHI